MFEIIKFIHELLESIGIQSQISFISVSALFGAISFGLLGFYADKEYRTKMERPAFNSQGGAGGDAKVTGNRNRASGGNGGQGGLGAGGRGGNAEVTGNDSIARGGDGGNAAQPDGRGGPRTLSPGEIQNLPTSMWPYGYGGHGANAPEYDRRLKILTQIRREYLQVFPSDAPYIQAGIDQVPARWVNKRLEELGEAWRVQVKDGGYILPPLENK